ncbi:CRISPR-associated endonuclease Cas3'' [Streptomyces sp. NPDC059080]|uniref:type I-G CRISPR-associated helicase/endonuclease Cas3g n=1 Tax=Streptomyces sp. NPDC059080 TaxID=3346718 RepID=UPI0036A14156
MGTGKGFGDFVRCAFGKRDTEPYAYQRALAERRGPLPQLLRAPTGAGKTVAAVLPWLWRLMENRATADSTPHRLVYVLPMRTLVSQVKDEVGKWLKNLAEADSRYGDVELQVFMGGAERDDDAWQLRPEAPAILIGTQDMILSRALMRGYAESRARWPVSFGLLHFGTQWVFDETQLMGPALGTSAQLQGLREVFGTASPTASMWMSATLDESELRTSDHRGALDELNALSFPAGEALGQRLRGTRLIERVPQLPDEAKGYAQGLASVLSEAHEPGTRTLAVLNTVERATQVYEALRKSPPEAELVLLHSRFRPVEREEILRRVLCDPSEGPGLIVVATQVLEAGVDVTSRTLFTETTPWSSFVQRCGRCNREGEVAGGGRVLWHPPPRRKAGPGREPEPVAAPYEVSDLLATEEELSALEGQALTARELGERPVAQVRPIHALLRRRDLVQLFDTAPDLTGADLDVGPWIRDGDDRTVFVAWRELKAAMPEADMAAPVRSELCPAPVGEVRGLLTKQRRVWVKQRMERGWRRAYGEDVVPGSVVVLDAGEGGYSSVLGWRPSSKAAVSEVPRGAEGPGAGDLGSDRRSFTGQPMTLERHLTDVEEAVAESVRRLSSRLSAGFSPALLDATRIASRYHDLGKCHEEIQERLRAACTSPVEDGVLLAKSGNPSATSQGRKFFRHEVVSALMLLHPNNPLLESVEERDLIAYLACAHHGKARVTVRAVGDEGFASPPRLLGVEEGDSTPEFTLPSGERVPELKLSLDLFRFGTGPDGREGWTQRVLRLRDREDLGPFRLAFLEALVRTSDWRASRLEPPSDTSAASVSASHEAGSAA